MAVKSEIEIIYPTSDGKPMGETDWHRRWMNWIIQRLEWHFRGQRVYVSGNLLIYYEEGKRNQHISPDAFVVKDCEPKERPIFQIWEEKRVPNFTLETTSRSTRNVDLHTKKELYARLGVQEYMLYDPTGDWLDELLAFQLVAPEEYEIMTPDENGAIVSNELGIRFQLINGYLEMFDAETDERLLVENERTEKERREKEEAQKRAADLEKEIERLRKQLEGK